MRTKFLFIAVMLVLTACSGNAPKQLIATGGPRYGGELRFMSPEKITALLPVSASDVYTQRISIQLFETLLKIDLSGTKIVPCLAESFTVSRDGNECILKIRKGVFFHDDPCFSGGKGRELTAQDVKFSLEFACSGMPENEVGNLLINKIAGARIYHASTTGSIAGKEISGIRVANDQTLHITLVSPLVGFDKILTHSSLGIFPKEAFEAYGHNIRKHPVGTGAFMLESWTAKGISLKRNPNYWKKDKFGNQLPFLDKVSLTYSKNKKDELLAFRRETIDLILKIPADEIENTLGTLQEAQAGKNIKHRVDSKTSLSLNYFGMANGKAPFSDIRVRKAFNLALDRNALVNIWQKGEGYPSLNGFVPPMEGYPTTEIKGFTFDVAQAKSLLAHAGFPDGAGFPPLEIYVNSREGNMIHLLARGVTEQLKQNLNIDLTIRLCSLEEREAAVKSGKALIWKSGWVADYPDPENFLNLFYSGGSAKTSNPFQYRSQQYNANLEAATRERNAAERTRLLLQCDQQIIDDAIVIPLLNDDFITMANARIRNFETNPMEILDFSAIFIKEPKK